ncbi:MAG: large-conductance mechanosensitive channel protein MscL [Gemmataceae bacterium]
MGLVNEFREFALRGNVVDLAVGVIIGGAFGKIVNSLVTDILMPPIGWAIGGVKFDDLALKLQVPGTNPATNQPYAPVEIEYGKFLQTTFDFLIIALVLFFVIRLMNKLKKKEVAKPVELSLSEKTLLEIRDSLRK